MVSHLGDGVNSRKGTSLRVRRLVLDLIGERWHGPEVELIKNDGEPRPVTVGANNKEIREVQYAVSK